LNIGKKARLKDKVTIAQDEPIPNIWWNGTMFGDLDWPLNVSRLSASSELLVTDASQTRYIQFN